MEEQSYKKHAKFVPAFHYFLGPIEMLTFLAAAWNLSRSLEHGSGRLGAVILLSLAICVLMASVFARVFALKAQDRAIRAEENLRHFAATGKLLDKRLSVKQIVALRFASDGEFVALAQRATAENLPPDTIKREIKSWKIDTDRL